jgi:hypothetical protein
MSRVEVMSGPERRRRWSEDQKRAVGARRRAGTTSQRQPIGSVPQSRPRGAGRSDAALPRAVRALRDDAVARTPHRADRSGGGNEARCQSGDRKPFPCAENADRWRAGAGTALLLGRPVSPMPFWHSLELRLGRLWARGRRSGPAAGEAGRLSATMAPTNKCLAQGNKSRTGAKC